MPNLAPQLAITSNPYLATLATIATAAAQQQQQHQFAAVAALALQQQLAAVSDPLTLANPLLGSFCGSANTSSSSSINPNQQLYGPNPGVRTPAATVLAQQLTTLPSTSRYFPTQTLIPTLNVAQPVPLTVTAATIPKQPEGPDGANLFIYHLPGMTPLSLSFSLMKINNSKIVLFS